MNEIIRQERNWELFRAKVVEVAISEIGRGEQGGNNVGPDLARYGAKPGDNWCALFVGYCYQEAARQLYATLNFELSKGAKRLTKNIAAHGRKYKDPMQALPGDVVCWNRGPIGSWLGHIEIVEREEGGLIHTIGGNVGAPPAKVRRLIHDVKKERLFMFAGL